MKRAVAGLVRLLVDLFYRRVEVTGLDNVPGDLLGCVSVVRRKEAEGEGASKGEERTIRTRGSRR